MSERPDRQKELPPEIRECMIDTLAEILVLDYRQTHGLDIPTDHHHRSEVNGDTPSVVCTVFIRRAAAGEGDDALAMLHRQIEEEEVRNISKKIKKIIHDNHSPTSEDKSVHKIGRPSKTHAILHR